jgi:hypothetical protein
MRGERSARSCAVLIVLGTPVACCLLSPARSGAADADVGTPPAAASVAAGSSIGGLLELEEDQFTLPGSNGWQITVTGFLGGGHSVTLYARRGHSEVEYTVAGKVTEEEIKASFGSLGFVAFHFEPSGQVREAVDYCDSTQRTVEVKLGNFVGTIRFRGELGYTTVDAGRAEGGVGNDLALPGEPENGECQAVAAGGEIVRKAEFTSLEAKEPKSHIQFTAIATTEVEGEETSSPAISRVILAAGSTTKEKRMTVRRSVLAEAPTSDFSFDAALDSASIGPLPPFSGTGRFRKNTDGTSSWTGSLEAPVPGLGTVRLAGPGFHARFDQSHGTIIH